jgi:GntR family transcriptional regulator
MPKYLVLVEVLEDMVQQGEIGEGTQLPAESAIANSTPLSLGTIQKAMSVLEQHGIVSREHGRGTFVRGVSAQLHDLWHFRFLADDGKTILPVYPTVNEVSEIREDGPWNAHFDEAGPFVRITRSINVGNEFMVASEFFIPSRIGHSLVGTAVTELRGRHLRDLLRDRFGLVTARVADHVACRPLPAHVAGLIGQPKRAMALVCHLSAFDFRGAPVSFQIIYVPANARWMEIREIMP